MDSVAEISAIVADSISALSICPLSLHVAFLHLAQYKILLCCFFIKRIDLIPKLARHLHLPAHRLACVCSLTKDTYVFECIFPILSGICQCAGVCACRYSPRLSFPFAWLDLNAEISMLHTSRFHSVAGRPLLKDIWYALHWMPNISSSYGLRYLGYLRWCLCWCVPERAEHVKV